MAAAAAIRRAAYWAGLLVSLGIMASPATTGDPTGAAIDPPGGLVGNSGFFGGTTHTQPCSFSAANAGSLCAIKMVPIDDHAAGNN